MQAIRATKLSRGHSCGAMASHRLRVVVGPNTSQMLHTTPHSLPPSGRVSSCTGSLMTLMPTHAAQPANYWRRTHIWWERLNSGIVRASRCLSCDAVYATPRFSLPWLTRFRRSTSPQFDPVQGWPVRPPAGIASELRAASRWRQGYRLRHPWRERAMSKL